MSIAAGAAAKCNLLVKGIDNPSEEQITEEAHYLVYPETRPAIALGKRLTKSEIQTLYYIMCGENISCIAAKLVVSPVKIKQ